MYTAIPNIDTDDGKLVKPELLLHIQRRFPKGEMQVNINHLKLVFGISLSSLFPRPPSPRLLKEEARPHFLLLGRNVAHLGRECWCS